MSKKLLEENTKKRWKKLAGINEARDRYRTTRPPSIRKSEEEDYSYMGQPLKGHIEAKKDELMGSRTFYQFVVSGGPTISLGQSDMGGPGNDLVDDSEYNLALTKVGYNHILQKLKEMKAEKDAATQAALDKDAEDRFNALDTDTSIMHQ